MKNTQSTSATLAEIVQKINTKIKSVAPKRIDDFGEFHDFIRSEISQILSENGLLYSTWYIRPVGSDFREANIFYLEIDLTEDKRSAYRRGKLNDLFFEISEPYEKEFSVGTAIELFKYNQRESAIKKMQDFIVDQTAAIADTKRRIAEYQKQQKQFKNKFK